MSDVDAEAAKAQYALQIPSSLHRTLFNIAKRLTSPSICSRAVLLSVESNFDWGEFLDSGVGELVIEDGESFSSFGKSRDDRDRDRDVDVITKTVLPKYASEMPMQMGAAVQNLMRRCGRCEGVSEKRGLAGVGVGVGGGGSGGVNVSASRRWKAWTRRWEGKCVCGGLWVLGA